MERLTVPAERLRQATEEKAAAEAALAAAQAQIAEGQKAAKKSDPDVAAFEVALGNFQSQFNQLTGYVLKVSGRNPELGAKMKKLVGDQLSIFVRKVDQ